MRLPGVRAAFLAAVMLNSAPAAEPGSSPAVASDGVGYSPTQHLSVPATAWESQPLSPGVSVQPRHGERFGSPNLTLSREGHILDLFGAGLFGEDANTTVVGQSGPADRSFVQAEYLLWWVRGGDVPVLASTATAPSLGYLGMMGTQSLLGPGNFGDTSRQGVRVRGGTVFGPSGFAGIDAGVFYLGQQSTDFRIDSDQFPTIARPFFAPNFNQEFGELVAFPGLSTGALEVRNASTLWGADVNTRAIFCNSCDARREAFAGYRHLNLRESLAVTEFITAGPNAPDPAGTRIVVQDSFRVANQFHGGQVGYAFARRFGALEFDARVSVALGATRQELSIAGFQNRTRPGERTETFTGGLLAAGPNLGRFTRTRFAVAPEATVNLGLRLTDRLKASVGYNCLAWTNVLRPGDQIDRTVDVSFVPNGPPVGFVANRPLPTFSQSNLWAQGVQFGVEYRW